MRSKTLFGWTVVLAVVLCVFFGQPVLADITGSVWGIVRDSSGAAVAGASVTLSNAETGLKRQLSSDETGRYEFLAVPVGQGYLVEVEAPGFKKFVQSDLRLLVNQRFRIDVVLTVGELSQRIEVTAAEAQVETANTQLGDVILDRKMTGLPLNGRSFTDLMGLQAGVVPISGLSMNDRPISGELNSGAFSVNGNRETGNSFLVNGGDVEESKNNGASVAPNLDSIQEFRVLTNSFDAEFGRFAGGIVNVVTKSGTNGLHGTVFEFLRNEKLDARNFFDRNQSDPVTGQEIPNSSRGVFKRNQFGAAVGGPILKDKLFFFGDYQGTREVRGLTTGITFVPSQAEKNGDFSDVTTAGFPELTGTVRGDNVPGNHTFDETLTDRLGYTVKSGEPYWASGCNSAADAQAGNCVFPGQVIPQSAWSAVPKETLKFIPNPNGFIGGTPYWSSSNEKRRLRDDKFGVRITFNNKPTGDWSVYYHYDNSLLLDPFGDASVPGFPGTTPNHAQQANVSNTRVINSTTVNELRLNYTRLFIQPGQPSPETLASVDSFGFVKGGLGIIPAVPQNEAMPFMGINGAYGVSIGNPLVANPQINNTYQVSENFSKVTGRHTLKFGAEFRFIQVDKWNVSWPSGQFNFQGNETGNPFADYLLGAPDGYSQVSYSSMFDRSKYFAAFAQDSFKLKPNITVNMGLRWDISQFFYEKQDRLNVIAYGMDSTLYPGSPTGWVFPGDPGISSTVAPTGLKNFAPRLGIAYSPDFKEGALGKLFGGPGKTSIRAAFGLYYTAVEDMPAFYTISDAPFGLYVNTGDIYLEEPFKDRRQGNDPGQKYPWSPPAPGSQLDWSIYQPIGGSPAPAVDNVLPRVMHWNFTIQRELPKSTILTMGYIGTRGRHLLAALNSNIARPERCLEIARIMTEQGRPEQGCGPFGADQIYDLNGDGQFTLGVDAFGTRDHSITSGRYASRGILDFARNDYNINMANSNYDAMQVSLEKKAGPLQLLGAYTFSKSLDNSSNWVDRGINPYNYGLSKALSAFDMTHNFVVSYTYELPFHDLARGSVIGKVLEGWRVSGITRFTTGLPVNLGASGDRSLGTGDDRPNHDGSSIQFVDPRATESHTYFSPQPFSREELGVLGNASHRFFHGPGLNNWDFMLQKVTRIRERFSVELRAEFFNMFNHAQFNNPGGTFGGSSFSRVTSARDPRIGQLALKFYF